MPDIDPNIQLYVKREIEKHKGMSDITYAIKLVEKIVFYAVGAASIAVLGGLLKLVIL